MRLECGHFYNHGRRGTAIRTATDCEEHIAKRVSHFTLLANATWGEVKIMASDKNSKITQHMTRLTDLLVHSPISNAEKRVPRFVLFSK